MMRITVLYFAALRERLGPGEAVELQARAGQPWRVRDLMQLLQRQSPVHTAAFTEIPGLRAAMDLHLCSLDTEVHDGAELAIFPPVTGG